MALLAIAGERRTAWVSGYTWFEYVRSKANPADEPSRVDLSSVRWRVLACPELVSEPVPVSWPQEDNWRDPAGWARLAAGRAAAATGW